MADPLVTVEVPVKVRGVKVTDTFDPKQYKDSVEKRIKPQIEKGLAKIKVQIPKGKKLGAFAVDVNISVKKTDKGVMVIVRTVPSENNNMLGGTEDKATVPVPKDAEIEADDVNLAADTATKGAIKSATSAFAETAKEP
jgi:hypothetical protein